MKDIIHATVALITVASAMLFFVPVFSSFVFWDTGPVDSFYFIRTGLLFSAFLCTLLYFNKTNKYFW